MNALENGNKWTSLLQATAGVLLLVALVACQAQDEEAPVGELASPSTAELEAEANGPFEVPYAVDSDVMLEWQQSVNFEYLPAFDIPDTEALLEAVNRLLSDDFDIHTTGIEWSGHQRMELLMKGLLALDAEQALQVCERLSEWLASSPLEVELRGPLVLSAAEYVRKGDGQFMPNARFYNDRLATPDQPGHCVMRN